MKTIRTPESRFENLKDYNFEPHYTEVDAGDGTPLRMHYVDEGEGEIILCLHGQPSWSYLYRHMIPLLTKAGYRVIAPDLVGFGKSDKPVNRADYTFANHVLWLKGFVEALDLSGATVGLPGLGKSHWSAGGRGKRGTICACSVGQWRLTRRHRYPSGDDRETA